MLKTLSFQQVFRLSAVFHSPGGIEIFGPDLVEAFGPDSELRRRIYGTRLPDKFDEKVNNHSKMHGFRRPLSGGAPKNL